MKKRIVMLVASDPDSDPRIDWEASYAPREFAITAIGACGPTLRGPTRELRSRYAIVRLVSDGRGSAGFLRSAAKLMVAGWLLPILAAPLLPLAVAVAAVEWLRRGRAPSTHGRGRIGRRPVYEALRQAARIVLTPFGLRIPISFFRHVVIASAALWRGVVAERPDEQTIVHCNDLETLLVGVMARRAYGCKVVYDCHEFLPHAWPDATRWNRWLLGRYEGWLIRFADSVITVNPLLAAEIMRAYRGIEVQSVPNAEPLHEERAEDDAHPLPLSRRERGDSAAAGRRRPLEFLFQGGFGPGRGIEELIRAWQAIDPNDAVLLLRGNDHANKTLCVRLAAALGLKDVSVFFPPPVRENCLIATAATADIGVIPYMPTIVNFRYCCPNKLSQYMQAGLPIMAGNTAYVSRILDESGAGLCYDPADPASIAATVRRLVQDEALRQECRENAARFVRETFHWQARSKPLYDAYRRLAGIGEVKDDADATVAQQVA
jgi:glycosyltransferase involved in cell wall biosynthesis